MCVARSFEPTRLPCRNKGCLPMWTGAARGDRSRGSLWRSQFHCGSWHSTAPGEAVPLSKLLKMGTEVYWVPIDPPGPKDLAGWPGSSSWSPCGPWFGMGSDCYFPRMNHMIRENTSVLLVWGKTQCLPMVSDRAILTAQNSAGNGVSWGGLCPLQVAFLSRERSLS